MKVIGIRCSPRRGGNSDTMVAAALEGAAEKGANVKSFIINDMNIRGCQACLYCRTHDVCAIKDDMQILYKELADTDAVVIGTPVYSWQYPAQAKLFVDRLYVYLNPDFTMRMQKPALILASQGDDDPGTFPEIVKKAGIVGLSIQDIIVATHAIEKDCVMKRPELLNRIKRAGESLVE